MVGVKDEGDDVVGVAKGVFVGVEVDIAVGPAVVGVLVGDGDEGNDAVTSSSPVSSVGAASASPSAVVSVFWPYAKILEIAWAACSSSPRFNK